MSSPFFKSAFVYSLRNDGINFEELAEMLATQAFRPCGSQDKSSMGWVAPVGEALALVQGKNALISTCYEEKIMPASVIKEAVEQKVDEISEEQQRPIGRADRLAIKDAIIHAYLPRAFTRKKHTLLWIDNTKKRLVVGASSAKEAELVLSLLRRCLGSLPVIPFTITSPIEVSLTQWVRDGQVSAGFSLLDEADLKAVLEDGGILRCKKQELVCDEILQHIESGKRVTRLALDWQERLQFVVGDDLSLKRMKFGHEIMEQNNDIESEDVAARFDADFMLFSAEFNAMFDALVEALGGEAKHDEN